MNIFIVRICTLDESLLADFPCSTCATTKSLPLTITKILSTVIPKNTKDQMWSIVWLLKCISNCIDWVFDRYTPEEPLIAFFYLSIPHPCNHDFPTPSQLNNVSNDALGLGYELQSLKTKDQCPKINSRDACTAASPWSPSRASPSSAAIWTPSASQRRPETMITHFSFYEGPTAQSLNRPDPDNRHMVYPKCT